MAMSFYKAELFMLNWQQIFMTIGANQDGKLHSFHFNTELAALS